MEKEKANLQNQLTDFEERMGAMTSHLKNVRQEFSFTQVNWYTRRVCRWSTTASGRAVVWAPVCGWHLCLRGSFAGVPLAFHLGLSQETQL